MSELFGSKYEGEWLDGWYHGHGKYYYPDGIIYEGNFYKGQFHGTGTLIYPSGGKYKAQWQNGKMIKGDYYFKDDLQYQFNHWVYCTNQDRRFYKEIQQGILPAGATQQTKENDQPHQIPEGTYDVGEGYYEPVKSLIYSYEGKVLRIPSENEVHHFIETCRYNPRVSLGPVSGEEDKIIQRVKLNNKQDREKSNK